MYQASLPLSILAAVAFLLALSRRGMGRKLEETRSWCLGLPLA
jgi:hypothetical protein